jgi:predicted kinase
MPVPTWRARLPTPTFWLGSPHEEEAYFRFTLPIADRSCQGARHELREREIPIFGGACRLQSGRYLLALGALAEPSAPFARAGRRLPERKVDACSGLAARAHAEVIRSDVVRKELARTEPEQSRSDAWRTGIYSPEWTVRTYAECRRRAEDLLFEGKRVIVDATFSDEALRQSFLELARSLCVPVVWFVCQASPESVRERLSARRGDASDADWAVYERARRTWDPESHSSRAAKLDIDTDGGEARALAQALATLHGGKNST